MLYACYRLSSDKMIAKILIKSKNTSIFLKKSKIIRHFAKSDIVFFIINRHGFCKLWTKLHYLCNPTRQRYELYMSQMR